MRWLLLVAAANAAQYFTREEPIDGAYIVVFKKHLAKNVMDAHKELVTLKNVHIGHQYSIGELFNGYAAKMEQPQLNFLLEQPEIDYIEQDGMAHIVDYFKEDKKKADDACTTQSGATWGLCRTSEVELRIDGNYKYDMDGAGVYSYIIDTGVYWQHSDFEGRASWGANFVDQDDFDGNGHGTHCAGTVGGAFYGMAKKCRIIGVKVLGASGGGAWSGVIAGINWVANDSTRRPATANLSLGGGKVQAVNDALDAAVLHGNVVMVAAAGNNNGDTCNFSPASAPLAIATGATDNQDRKATFSNHGRCMHLFAPGVAITSTWIGNPEADNTISGTSMASPHVCGMATKYLSSRPGDSPAMVKTWILSTASGNLVKSVPANTANLLLYAGCGPAANSTTVKVPNRYA